ncbi:MAG: enoyl-CoA hydratase [Acidimicrobiales bacterium]|nr:enoyl-CoA hydratase [Acidimicrobiales bacterium]
MDDVLHSEVADEVALVVMNRPESRNALNSLLLGGLRATLSSLDARADVRAIVLTGADPAFCAGLDLKQLEAGGSISAGVDDGQPFPPDMSTPVIGAINGPAVTGGLEIALACDLLIASERASFADTHARVGILPGWGLSVELPRAVGVRRARQMSFTGNYVHAEQALQWGLVNEVVPHEQLLERAMELGRDMATVPAKAAAAMKRLYWATHAVTAGDALIVEKEVNRSWAASGGFDPDALAASRAAIQARGSAQQGD